MLLNLFFLLLLNIIKNEPIFVFEHFRHGSRAPGFGLIKENPMGEYTDRYGVVWKSNGELTGIGLRMEYTLGVRNRYKYKKLFSTIFDPKELLVVSSSLNRALTSAQAQLEGMFPPLTGIELKEKELENSIPPIPITEAMQKEIDSLGKNALPEKIQIVPIHIFN
jgi:lysosomal acid phosphatase